ncbi:MAG: LLM class flavin-dependent oxidoreductase [Thermomicrobiales bacterium]
METQRGIGVAGALDHSIVRSLATEAERLGYATFWANDTPQGDGLASLAAAASTTGTIRLGVGVIAVDRIPADVIVSRVAELGLPVDRLLVGIGAGRTRVGSLDLIERSAAVLRAAGIASAVGALGPRMVNLAGRVADAALFNWLTPNAATESSAALALAAGDRAVEPITPSTGRLRPGFAGNRWLKKPGDASHSAYTDHFKRMGVRAVETCVIGESPEAIQTGLAAFDGSVHEIVVRAITGSETLDAYLSLARASAPAVK